jgi:hypothetical protein
MYNPMTFKEKKFCRKKKTNKKKKKIFIFRET